MLLTQSSLHQDAPSQHRSQTSCRKFPQIICIYSGNCIQYTKISIGIKKSRSLWPRPPLPEVTTLSLTPSLALSSLCVSQLSSPSSCHGFSCDRGELCCQPPAHISVIPVQLLRTPGLSTALSLQSKQIVCFFLTTRRSLVSSFSLATWPD